MRSAILTLVSLGLASAVLLAPVREADACGGTFCDSGPASMPVDQTGETILFALDGDFVEAHVQIQYDGGDASKFAWIVPVTSVPEVEVGSFRLIQNALDATVPIYGLSEAGACDGGNPGGVGFIMEPDAGSGGGGPQVVVHDTVGVFEYVVLQGGDADSIGQWLADNEYAPDAEAPQILDQYIVEGHVFVAFKLLHSAGLEDLHPIILRYAGNEPCIPIRLTRIAAADDMPIRALFLGTERVMPENYRHVLLNRVRLDWINLGADYDQLVTLAIDDPGADGRAFVTEFAGASSVVDTTTLETGAYDPNAFTWIPATAVVDALEDQELASCGVDFCTWGHELVPSLLHEFVPVPPGVEEGEFYACLPCFAAQIDAAAWDGAAFAAALAERVVAPMDHARSLLETWPYLTRLYTRISPHEMTVDPTFAELPGLDDVANRHGAQRTTGCCNAEVRLPGGRIVALQDMSVWPMWPDEMPWAERIEELLPGGGPPAQIVDASAAIDAMVDAHNAAIECEGTSGDPPGTSGPSDGDGSSMTDTLATSQGDADSSGSAGGGGLEDPSGCGCGSERRDRGTAGFAATIVLALWRRRR